MSYQTSQASICVQCDDCVARTTYHANSVNAAVILARDDGWKIGAATQRGCIMSGPCLCDGCVKDREMKVACRRGKRAVR